MVGSQACSAALTAEIVAPLSTKISTVLPFTSIGNVGSSEGLLDSLIVVAWMGTFCFCSVGKCTLCFDPVSPGLPMSDYSRHVDAHGYCHEVEEGVETEAADVCSFEPLGASTSARVDPG